MDTSMDIDSDLFSLECSENVDVSVLKEEASDLEEHHVDEDLPPILAPPSTGYFHTVDENQPPPELHPETEHDYETVEEDVGTKLKRNHAPVEVIDIEDSGSEKSSTTDSDDDLVDVDYGKAPPEKYTEMLAKFGYLASKDNWLHNVRKFYKKQPTRIRRLLKMHHDQDGNPIEEPMEILFEKIHAERERMRRAQNIKSECTNLGIRRPEETEASVSSVKVSDSYPKLVHVAYPGNVVNNDKAIATLGGLGAVSKVFDQPNKKLNLRFRPNDPFANGVNAPGRSVCGLLIRVRRKKDRANAGGLPQSETNGRPTEVTGDDPAPAGAVQDLLLDNQLHSQQLSLSEQFDNSVTINDKVFRAPDIAVADRYILDDIMKQDKASKAWSQHRSKEYNLKVPKQVESVPSHCSVQTVGIVHRSYEFNGICDFQYLPISKNAEGTLVSVKDKIFPVFGAADMPEKLVMKHLINEDVRCQTFSLPPTMSRIDNPPRGLMDELIVSEKCESSSRKEPQDDSVFSSRRKRIIFTISYNFIGDSKSNKTVKVPSRPLPLAVEDVERRQIKKDLVDMVRSKFDERPIWSKSALEFATKIPSQILKYIIPTFAYFAANGPWRNTWIKFGIDPRRHQRLVLFQAVDFRVPFIYRRFMNSLSNPEANHKYIPGHLPPKTQMFYQLCDILLDEIKELIVTLERKAEMGTLIYNDKYGFLKEGTYEYFRYLLTYHLENLLQDNGKIPTLAHSEPSVRIPPGEIEPTDKLKAAPHRRVKVKRIRRSLRKVVDPTTSPKKTKGQKGSVKTYQATLEDLALNDLPNHPESSGIEGDEFYDDEEDEYSD